ncbi:hypothetical protein IFR05_008197 [Cadophora sp. M221]|nr:hypothetical protein IFR05_008197 [Cadophora sp. M221]
MHPTLDVQVQSTSTIFPSTPLNKPTTTALSILDNTSANFARCAAIWYFPPSISTLTLNSNDLQVSLSHTLNSYRPWCGRLSYASSLFTTHGTQSARYQRISTTYNTPNDIGISLTVATSPHPLSLFLPSPSTRKTCLKAWNAPGNLPSSTLLPTTKLSISSSSTANSPNVVIQLTTFACGSLAIGIAITHCLADALSLSKFANDWGLTTRSLTSSKSLSSLSPNLPELSPVFDPQRLDAHAAGDINGPPDEEIQRKARELPQHRYDWYTPVSDQPWPNPKPKDFDDVVARAAMDGEVGLSPSIPIPWGQWDTNLLISHRLLHFSREEILAIYKQANSGVVEKEKSDGDGNRISKHDALLAHLWSLIITSRNLPEGTTCYLDLTFGVRSRVDPPPPDGLLGSPVMHVAIPFTSTSNSLPTPSSNPKVDDEELNGDMPLLDGLVEIMEAPRDQDQEKSGIDGGSVSWIDDGVDVSVFLEASAIERLLGNQRLWGGV